jgi:hypothetical protein
MLLCTHLLTAITALSHVLLSSWKFFPPQCPSFVPQLSGLMERHLFSEAFVIILSITGPSPKTLLNPLL